MTDTRDPARRATVASLLEAEATRDTDSGGVGKMVVDRKHRHRLSLAAAEFAPYTNAAYYFVSGSGHTFLLGSGSQSVNGVTLEQFITQMVTDAPTWTSEHP